MNTINEMMMEIGEDADLLTRSDLWLEEEKQYFIDLTKTCIDELKSICMALIIKRSLQEKNIVPMQRLLRNAAGGMEDIVIELRKLPDAIKVLQDKRDEIDELFATGNMLVWGQDGYDISTSREIAGI